MKQVAIFTDAGYLYGGGSVALVDSVQQRASMNLKLPETIARLKATASEKAKDVSLLRIYWYDGLLRGSLSQEQEALAYMDNVKVRLGAVTAGQQKGVDSLIVTDLIELARNHAISDAVLLSGDEDIRVGVQIAQSFGVRVHLIGIEPNEGTRNQSYLLQQEADTIVEWSKEDIQEILSIKPDAETNLPVSRGQTGSEAIANDTGDILDRVALEIFNSISETELQTLVEALSQDSRWIPKDYDGRLLAESGTRIGRDLYPNETRRIRDKFKEIVNSAP